MQNEITNWESGPAAFTALPPLRLSDSDAGAAISTPGPLGGAHNLASDDLIRKQCCNDGNTNKAAKENCINHAFDMKA
jgi:hypothetical protein